MCVCVCVSVLCVCTGCEAVGGTVSTPSLVCMIMCPVSS